MAFAVSLICFVGSSESVQAQPTLDFLNQSVELKLHRIKQDIQERCPLQSGKDVDVRTGNATVFVLLGGSKEGLNDLEFEARVQPKTGKWGEEPTRDQIDETDVDVCWAEVKEEEGNVLGPTDRVDYDQVKTSIGRSEVKPFVLFIESHSAYQPFGSWLKWTMSGAELPIQESTLSGHLLVTDKTNPDVVQGTLPVELSRTAPVYEGDLFGSILQIFVYAFGSAAVILFVVALSLIWSDSAPVSSLGQRLELEFKNRWVSNLTTAGAILGTILSAGVLPNDTFFMAKQQYISLNLLFGLVLVIATVFFNLISRVWAFVLASAVTLAAGISEVVTVLLILKEMQFQGSIPATGVEVTQIILSIATVIFVVVAGFRVIGMIRNPPSTSAATDIYTRLGVLVRMCEEGKITEEEFNNKKTTLLGRL